MSYETHRFLNRNEELVFQQALDHMDRTIDDLFRLLPDPIIETIGDGIRDFRFTKKDSQSAIVLKLVQFTSNLRAGRLLIDHGFAYEWSVLKRLLNETVEDIGFLLAENQDDNQGDLHERFLDAFYEGDLDNKGDLKSESVNNVKRSEIRKFLIEYYEDVDVEVLGEGIPPPEEVMRGLYRLGSGYIHGRAVHIMSLYDEGRNRFHTNGWNNEEHLASEREDFFLMALWAILRSIGLRKRWGVDGEFPVTLLEGLLWVLGKLQAGQESGSGMASSHIGTP